jgi:oligopeptide transport system permease protein
MLGFVLKRCLGAIPTLWLLATLTFFLLRLAPGGPFDSDRAWPPEIKANIERKYELDQPIRVQYAHWMRDLARGDLRESFQYLGRPVTEIIGQSLPTSLGLGALALLFAVGLGVPAGAVAAWKRGTWLDSSAVFLAVAGVSLPSYLVASVLILVFSLWLRWFPPALWDGPSSWVLPAITLGSRPLAIVARLTRATMLEALQSDYVRTAYGKGLSPARVVFKHALRNSLIPVITVLGPVAAGLVTGSFLVEIVFQIPGIGRHFVQAVINRDYPLVMGVTLVYGVALLLSNLLVDLAYGLIDPRMRVKA